jgi:hypothetical protein
MVTLHSKVTGSQSLTSMVPPEGTGDRRRPVPVLRRWGRARGPRVRRRTQAAAPLRLGVDFRREAAVVLQLHEEVAVLPATAILGSDGGHLVVVGDDESRRLLSSSSPHCLPRHLIPMRLTDHGDG